MHLKLCWSQSAKKVLAKINGLNPNPGAWFQYNKGRYKVWKAKIVNESGGPGEIERVRITLTVSYDSNLDDVKNRLVDAAITEFGMVISISSRVMNRVDLRPICLTYPLYVMICGFQR